VEETERRKQNQQNGTTKYFGGAGFLEIKRTQPVTQ